jgi:hypothetical protein
MAPREEWQEQKKLARLLDQWLDPACTFWIATHPVAASALSGAIRKQRGVKPGVPDVLVWYCGKSITIELKSRQGKCSPSQRLAREALLRGRAVVAVSHGARGDVGAGQFGREIPRARPQRRHDGALAAAPARALGGAAP